MGNSESKVQLRQLLFQLTNQERTSDETYWRQWWLLPESTEDIFLLLSRQDLQSIVRQSPGQVQLLMEHIGNRLVRCMQDLSRPETRNQQDVKILCNCLSLFTRWLPFVFESPSLISLWDPSQSGATAGMGNVESLHPNKTPDAFQSPVDGAFNQSALRPLGQRLMDAVVRLLFFPGFTLPEDLLDPQNPIQYIVWEAGIGASRAPVSTRELDANRIVVLRLLLVLLSRSMYVPMEKIQQQPLVESPRSPRSPVSASGGASGVNGGTVLTPMTLVENKFLHYLLTETEKPAVLAIICCLLNVVMVGYQPVGWLPYDHLLFQDSRELLSILCVHVLTVLLNEPILIAKPRNPVTESQSSVDGLDPGNHQDSRRSSMDVAMDADGNATSHPDLTQPEFKEGNRFRYHFARLHRPQDLRLITQSFLELLSNPMRAQTTYLPNSMKRVVFIEELLMLFWKFMEVNPRLFGYVCESESALELMKVLLFQLISCREDVSKMGLMRMCSFLLHMMSGERSFAVLLNKPYLGDFVAASELPAFTGTHADLLALSVYTVITSTKGRLTPLYDSLLTALANISPYIKSFSLVTANKLMRLFVHFSNPVFLLASEHGHILVFYIVEMFNNIIQYQFDGNAHVVYEVLRNQQAFDKLHDLTFDEAYTFWVAAKEKRRQKEGGVSNGDEKAAGDTMADQVTAEEEERPLKSISNRNQSAPVFGHQEDQEVQQSLLEDVPETKTAPISPHVQDKPPSRSSRSPSPVRPASPLATKPMNPSQPPPSHAFEPNEDWFDYWHSKIPLQTILSLLDTLAPEVERLCEERQWNDEAVIQFLQTGTLVGLLPQPHPLFVRRFMLTEGIRRWFTSYLWGVVYLRHSTVQPSSVGGLNLWLGTRVQLFTVKSMDPKR